MMSSVYLGIRNHIVCLCANSGEENWRVKLGGNGVTCVIKAENNIFAYSGGKLFCVNAETGEIVWCNNLPKLSYGPCCICYDYERCIDKTVGQQITLLNEVQESISSI